MKSRAIFVCGLGCVTSLALSRPMASAESVDDDVTITSLIVERLPGRSTAAARSDIEQSTTLDTSVGTRLGGRFETIEFDTPISVADAEDLAASLEADGLVATASPDYPRFAATAPNDPEWPNQWSLQPFTGASNSGIGLEAAWSLMNGNTLGFTPVPPMRVLDTRDGTGGVPTSRIGNSTGTAPDLNFTITGTGGIPTTGVAAVSLNVTVTDTNAPDEGGYVTVYPCATGRPNVSNLNFTNRQIIPNAVIVPVDTNGQICLHVYGTAHLIIDINGWYPPDNIIVAVIDTGRPIVGGIDHPDMVGQVVDGYDLMSVSGNRDPRDGDGWDPDETDSGDWETSGQCGTGSAASSSSWHGAHVAGIIAAESNNNLGIAGINPRAKVQHVRVLGSCGGLTSDEAAAIRWAAGLAVAGVPPNPTPADVINLSLGGPGPCSAVEQNAIDATVGAGSIVVVAAGNSNSDLDSVAYAPANCDNVITVAGTEINGSRLFLNSTTASNYGSKVEIAAPGRGIKSTTIDSQTSPVANWVYQNKTGTSMSTPTVAGIVSLMLSKNATLTRSQVLSILQQTASPFPAGSTCSSNINNTLYCGAGIVHAGAALQAVQGDGAARAMSAMTPMRVLDTRDGTGGVPTNRIGNSTGTAPDLNFTITGTGGIPTTGVAAVSLNVTVTDTNAPDEGGYVTVYPCATGRPNVSNLNFTNRQIIPNAVIVPVDTNGQICLHVYGTAHLIIDINGWYPA